jgi:hypothetical protein
MRKPSPKNKSATVVEGDPIGLNRRLYAQLGKLLDDMEAADRDERMTMPQRISALIAIGRLQKMFVDLRKGEINGGAGSAIARYSAAFAEAHGTGSRNGDAGSNIVQFDGGGGEDSERDDFDA